MHICASDIQVSHKNMQVYEINRKQITESAGQIGNAETSILETTTVSVGIVVYLLVNVPSTSRVFAHLLTGARESH